jgi:hypothetical protein
LPPARGQLPAWNRGRAARLKVETGEARLGSVDRRELEQINDSQPGKW